MRVPGPESTSPEAQAAADLSRSALRWMLQGETSTESFDAAELFLEHRNLFEPLGVSQEAQDFIDDMAEKNSRISVVSAAAETSYVDEEGNFAVVDEDLQVAALGAEDKSISIAHELARRGLPWLAPIMIRHDVMYKQILNWRQKTGVFSTMSLRYCIDSTSVQASASIMLPYDVVSLERYYDDPVPEVFMKRSVPYWGEIPGQIAWNVFPAHLALDLQNAPKKHTIPHEGRPESVFIDQAKLTADGVRRLAAFFSAGTPGLTAPCFESAKQISEWPLVPRDIRWWEN